MIKLQIIGFPADLSSGMRKRVEALFRTMLGLNNSDLKVEVHELSDGQSISRPRIVLINDSTRVDRFAAGVSAEDILSMLFSFVRRDPRLADCPIESSFTLSFVDAKCPTSSHGIAFVPAGEGIFAGDTILAPGAGHDRPPESSGQILFRM